ncbi:MAG: type II toxin-antitoxin system VapC family toxin [Bacteroidia bacterium]
MLDTDTISFYFRNHKSVVSHLDEYLIEFGFVNLSVVTYYEIMNGLYFKDAQKQLEKFERFAELNEILPMTQKAAKKAAQIFSALRKNGVSIGHNEVMIAAIAIENDLKLITNNENHFRMIADLDWENWLI